MVKGSRWRYLLHAIGWTLIVVGLILWIRGTQGSPMIFLVGIVIEGIGFFIADQALRKDKKE